MDITKCNVFLCFVVKQTLNLVVHVEIPNTKRRTLKAFS